MKFLEMATVAQNVGKSNMKITVDNKAHYPRFNVRKGTYRVSIEIPEEIPTSADDLTILTSASGQQDYILTVSDLNDLVMWLGEESSGVKGSNLDEIKQTWNKQNPRHRVRYVMPTSSESEFLISLEKRSFTSINDYPHLALMYPHQDWVTVINQDADKLKKYDPTTIKNYNRLRDFIGRRGYDLYVDYASGQVFVMYGEDD